MSAAASRPTVRNAPSTTVSRGVSTTMIPGPLMNAAKYLQKPCAYLLGPIIHVMKRPGQNYGLASAACSIRAITVRQDTAPMSSN